MKNKYFWDLPVSGSALDFIKICAVVFMVVDHIDLQWLDRSNLNMAIIGRATYPLFCYATACSVIRHGEKVGHYAASLLFLAVITEPISQMFRSEMGVANVMFTLAAGGVMASYITKLSPWLRHALFAGAVVSCIFPATIEFGVPGVMLPSAIYLFLKKDFTILPWLLLIILTMNMPDIITTIVTQGLEQTISFGITLGLGSIVLPVFILLFSREIKGNKRLFPKYALHIFYPGHIAVLGIIAYFAPILGLDFIMGNE